MRKGAASVRSGLRLPMKGSRGKRVLQQLFDAPCHIKDIKLRHAEFGLCFSEVKALYEGLMSRGCAEIADDVFSITPEARRQLTKHLEAVAEVAGQVAGPAYRIPPTPLRPTRVRQADMREGASDYRSIPSRVGDQRYAHVSLGTRLADDSPVGALPE